MKFCKYCGKEIVDGDYRKIFCGHSCSASYNNKERKHTEEERIKISQSLQKKNPNFKGIFKPIETTQHCNYIQYNPTITYYCINCGEEIKNSYGSKANKFCCRKCQSEYEYNDYISKWKSGEIKGLKGKYGLSVRIRKYMLEKSKNQCENCGFGGINPYTNKSILQIHHIDGDCTNNTEENLRVLCPNCHAMTDNFGSRNKNATSGRSKYFKKA